jgi:2-polyprenyl-3-methyl-5-hydroxy-6-metoxy-1,4-benzoquinol methylase
MKKNIDVGRTFNEFAELYNEVSNQYTIKRRYQRAASFSKGKLLDVGGASGMLLPFLNPNTESIVVDISYNMCLEAKKIYNAEVICADAEALPFVERSFDTIVSLEVIYYLRNPSAFIEEIERLLKPNGLCILSFYNSKLNFLVTIRSYLRKLKFKKMFINDGDPSFTKLEELYRYIDGTSLEISKVDSMIFIPFKSFDRINRILENTFLKKFALFNVVVIKQV